MRFGRTPAHTCKWNHHSPLHSHTPSHTPAAALSQLVSGLSQLICNSKSNTLQHTAAWNPIQSCFSSTHLYTIFNKSFAMCTKIFCIVQGSACTEDWGMGGVVVDDWRRFLLKRWIPSTTAFRCWRVCSRTGIAWQLALINRWLMMMIAIITFKSSLVPLFEGLWSSNSWEFELSGF